MPGHSSDAPDGIELVADEIWTRIEPRVADLGRLDPGLRSVLAMLYEDVAEPDKDWYQIEQRTGIRWDTGQKEIPEHLPLLVEYRWSEFHIAHREEALGWLGALGLEVDAAYFREGLPRYSTARIAVRADRPDRMHGKDGDLRMTVARMLNEPGAALRLELPGAAQPLGAESRTDLGLPPDGHRGSGATPDGSGTIIGIIDDGCAFAHPNFVRVQDGVLASRVINLWDQGAAHPAAAPGGFSYGRELAAHDIDPLLNAHVRHGIVDEDAVYRAVDYEIPEIAAHGTHVMDIAAGSGRAPTSAPGVAPNADIIFVQLPAGARARGGPCLDSAIVAGLRYIFDRAGKRPTVVNISYGGHLGPHDGNSTVEQIIDAEVAAQANRAVVVAAGNGFEADCHAGGNLAPGRGRRLRWVVKPEDPTANIVEVWYDAAAELEITLVTPAGTGLGPVALGAPGHDLKSKDGRRIGGIDHQKSVAPAALNRIKIILNPTGSLPADATTPLAPCGTWQIRLRNVGQVRARWDAWIERDVSGRPRGARRKQSHFDPDNADARGTLASYATGKLSISVGAYNTATQQVARYSACGPTRDGRRKPDVLAPAEEDAAGRGVLSASARSGRPRRMNGTSAAAPQVAGLVALLFQAAQASGTDLTAAQVCDLVRNGASTARPLIRPLLPNRHIEADDRRKTKQGTATIWPQLTGSGKANWPKARELLP